MTKAQRVRAALAGEAVDRVPISLWHHFPVIDATVDGLVGATVSFYEKYDIDLIKLMPTGMYSIVDYGATIEVRPGDSGTTQIKTSPIQSVQDWSKISSASPTSGMLADQVEVVRRVRAAVGPDVTIVETIFSPLTMAHKLAGDDLYQQLETNEDDIHPALEIFANDVIAFGKACLDAGADGFFFATQQGSKDVPISDELFSRVAAAYDIKVLEALSGDERNWCTLLHLHGNNPKFELADQYPIHAVNWHDRESGPPISEAKDITSRAMVAGIDRIGPAAQGDLEGAIAEATDAIKQSGGRRLIVAPNCVLPTSTQESLLKELRSQFEDFARVS
jgi:uroporphyrinogen decarboxylase